LYVPVGYTALNLFPCKPGIVLPFAGRKPCSLSGPGSVLTAFPGSVRLRCRDFFLILREGGCALHYTGILIIRKTDFNYGNYVNTMTETKGHFEEGRWVEKNEPAAGTADVNVIDKRFSEATKSVISSVDDVMKVTRDLVTTPEGKQYIEKTIRDTQTNIQKSFDEIISQVKKELDKTVKPKK